MKVAKFKTPEYLELVTEFPRTASGKVRKEELRKSIGAAMANAKSVGG